MNWEKIKKKYPKAWGLFVMFRAKANAIADKKGSYDGDIFKLRDLYDFFDKQGIYIELWFRENSVLSFAWHIHFINKKWEEIGLSKWSNKISYPITERNPKAGLYKTRTEAEEKAFEKSFEILEEKLNK